MVDVFVKTYQDLGMEMNNVKTKLLTMRYDTSAANSNISVNGNGIELVEQFNYLSSLFPAPAVRSLRSTSE